MLSVEFVRFFLCWFFGCFLEITFVTHDWEIESPPATVSFVVTFYQLFLSSFRYLFHLFASI